MTSYQTLYNPYTKQTRQIDLDALDAHSQIMALYQQGWTAPPAPSTTPMPKLTTATQPATSQWNLSPPEQQAIWQQQSVEQAQFLGGISKPTPVAQRETGDTLANVMMQGGKIGVTQDVYDKMGAGARKNLYVLKPTTLEKYQKMPDEEKNKYYPEARGVSAQVYAALGPGVKDKGVVYPVLKWHEQLTSVKEEEGQVVTAKSFSLQVGDAVVPFMHTVRNWNELPDWEKGLNLFVDVLVVASFAKPITQVAKQTASKLIIREGRAAITAPSRATPSGITMQMSIRQQVKAEHEIISNLAKEAGSARQDLRLKMDAIQVAERAGLMPKNMAIPKTRIQRSLMDNLERAANRAHNADLKFGQTFPNVQQLSAKQLARLEKTSGFQGLQGSVKDINSIQTKLAKEWKVLNDAKFARGKPGWWEQINKIDDLQRQLDKSYTKYQDVVLPKRFREPSSSTPEGWQSRARKWGKGKDTGVGTFVKVDEKSLDAAQQELYEMKKLARRGKLPADEQAALYDDIASLQKRIKSEEEWLKYKREHPAKIAQAGFEGETPRAVIEGDAKAAIEEVERLTKSGGPSKGMGGGTPEKGYGSQGQWTRAEFEAEKARVAEINARQPRLWETEAKPKTATAVKEQEATEEELTKLFEVKQKAAKAEELAEAAKRTKVPKVEEGKPKFGMAPKEKLRTTAKSIPPEVLGRMTYAEIARLYGNQAVEDAIGKPLTGNFTKSDIKTAQETNALFETQLAGATKAATEQLIKTYNATNNMNQAQNDAITALEAYTQTQTQTQTQTKVQTAVQTAVEEAVRDIVTKPPFKFVPKPRIVIPPPDDLQIEHVEGIPDNAGVLSFEDGFVSVRISPPYRGGSQDISYDHLKVHRKGKGSQEATLKVTGGKAPRLIQLSRGISRTSIMKGKRMTHTRQGVQRGPGIMDRQGRVHKQRRGSVI